MTAVTRHYWAVALLLSGAPIVPALAQSDSASVSIAIQVGPIVQLDLEAGAGFQFYIPTASETRGKPFSFGAPPHVSLAEIPFTVRGNTPVTVSVRPGILQGGVSQVGTAIAADGSGKTVGYRVVLEFPLGTPANPLKGLDARGRNVTSNATRSADASNGPLSGIMHIVPEVTRGEVASRQVHSGWYHGSVQAVVVADN